MNNIVYTVMKQSASWIYAHKVFYARENAEAYIKDKDLTYYIEVHTVE